MTTELPADVPTSSPAAPGPGRRFGRRGVLLENAVVLAVFAVVGAGAGWCWHRWATPTSGIALDGTFLPGVRVEGDFLSTDYVSLGRGFGVIGTYVVVCLVAGLVLGVLAALLCRRSELVTLLAVAGGSALAAFLCYRVGLAMSPPDPDTVAKPLTDGTLVEGNLEIAGRSPFVAWPFAALVGLAFTYLLTSGVAAGVDEARRLDDHPRG